MNLEFFDSPNGSGNRMCLIEGGMIVAKAGLTNEEIKRMLETGEGVTTREGEYQGKPSLTTFVGFASNGVTINVSAVKTHKGAPRAKVAIEYVD